MEKKCVCGVWASYGQEDLSRLMDGSDEKKAAACGAMSLFVMPKEGQEDAVQEALSRYVQEKRDSAEFSCVPIDLMRDIERVDSIISVQSCMLFVRADGSVHTGSRQHDNLHVTDIALEDILMCTMPRVTYRTDEKIKDRR